MICNADGNVKKQKMWREYIAERKKKIYKLVKVR
jgi:hypothetical protein